MRFSSILVLIGAFLLFLAVGQDPMDEETALARYGHADGTSATTEEILAGRDNVEESNFPVILVGIGGVILLGAGLVLKR